MGFVSSLTALITQIGTDIKALQDKQKSLESPANPAIFARDLEYWRAIDAAKLQKYVQSRGYGLITNGYGLMGDNTNFSKMSFLATDIYAGFGSFVTDVFNADVACDELIAIDTSGVYEFSFAIKSLSASNPLAYAYILCADMDGQPIQPHHQALIMLAIDGVSNEGIVIAEQDRVKFATWYNRHRTSTIKPYINTTNYQSEKGFVFDENYSRTQLNTASREYRQTTYDSVTGVWQGLILNTAGKKLKAGDKIAIAHASGSYLYPFTGFTGEHAKNNLSNHAVSDTWQKHRIILDPNLTAPSESDPYHRPFALRPYTAMIKVGFLLNRGVRDSKTAISAINFRRIA